jgi:hypothetical protein
MTTPTTTTDLTILKADVLGRVHTPVDQRDALMDAFERSGLSGAQFARLHGLRYSTFAHWRQRRKKLRCAEPGEARPLFEEVDVCSARQISAGLCISLPGGASVTIDRADQFPAVAALLNYLEHSC